MSEIILIINKVIIIFPILSTCIVRWIDVDDINLSSVGVGQCGECLQVVTLDQDVVRGIGAVADDALCLVLDQHRQFIAQPFLNVLGLVFPHKSIRLLGAQQFKQSTALIISQAFQRLNTLYQSSLGLGIHLVTK